MDIETTVSPPNVTDTESEGEEHVEGGVRDTLVLKVCITYHGNLTLLPAAKKYFSQGVPDLCPSSQSSTCVCVAGGGKLYLSIYFAKRLLG